MLGSRNCPFCFDTAPATIESRSLKSFTAAPSIGCSFSFSKTVPRILSRYPAEGFCAETREAARSSKSRARYLMDLLITSNMTPETEKSLIPKRRKRQQAAPLKC